MPASYSDDRWGGRLFDTNLPNLVKNNLLDFKSIYKDVQLISDEGVGEYLTSDAAVIYLPFCVGLLKGFTVAERQCLNGLLFLSRLTRRKMS
jgi:hypothetical protein